MDAILREGFVHHQSGRLSAAEQCYRKCVTLQANHFDSLHLLGVVCSQTGRSSEALEYLNRALRIRKDYGPAFNSRANVLRQMGRLDEALLDYGRAIAIQPNLVEAYSNRGDTLTALGRFQQALESIDQAIARKPDYSEAYNNRGNALKELKRYAEAITSYDKAISLNPRLTKAYNNRGVCLAAENRLSEAFESIDHAIRLQPDYAEAYYNRGNALRDQLRLPDALACYDKAIALRGDYHGALWNQANVLLLLGQFERGLPQFEFRASRQSVLQKKPFSMPQLSNVDELPGKRLLIWDELFFGDMIQFCRYALMAERCGAAVTISAPERLHQLLSTLSDTIAIVGEGQQSNEFDYQVPLMSLPLVFQTTLKAIPSDVPYLKAEPERVLKWKRHLGEDGFKIGICWQGSKLSEEGGRSFPLIELYPLSEIEGVRLISLQKYDGVEQLKGIPLEMKVEDLGADFDTGPHAFLDAAAVMEGLDLIVTCDTSIAHLAGALGRPNWVMLKHVPDWRWLLDRGDSPWYPTTRLFRQKTPNDWQPVFAEVREALVRELERKSK